MVVVDVIEQIGDVGQHQYFALLCGGHHLFRHVQLWCEDSFVCGVGH